jgi:hypothetical protein
MLSNVIDVDRSNEYLLLLKESAESHVSFNFLFERKELYDLYTQLRVLFQDLGE